MRKYATRFSNQDHGKYLRYQYILLLTGLPVIYNVYPKGQEVLRKMTLCQVLLISFVAERWVYEIIIKMYHSDFMVT